MSEDDPSGPRRKKPSRANKGLPPARPPGSASTEGSKPVRPTPVRQAMGSARPRTPADPPRRLVVDGTAWVVKVAGRGLTGRQADRGAPLLHLTFHSTEDGPPTRELLLVGRSLETYPEEELEALLARSSPYREPVRTDRSRRKDRRRGRS